MQPKFPLYLTSPKLYQLTTKLVHKEADLFEFADTIFHLQGGGQPNDKGWIVFQNHKFDVLGGAIDKESGSVTINEFS